MPRIVVFKVEASGNAQFPESNVDIYATGGGKSIRAWKSSKEKAPQVPSSMIVLMLTSATISIGHITPILPLKHPYRNPR